MQLVDKIRKLARAKGYSLTTLEVKLGFGNGTISRWNKSSPSADKLTKISDFFDVSIDYLLEKTDNPKSHLATPENIKRLQMIPDAHLHLIRGIEDMDLSDRDVDFILKVAKEYKLTKGGKEKLNNED